MSVAAAPKTSRIVYQYFNSDGTKYCDVTRVDKADGEKDCYTDPSGLQGPHPLYRAERLAGLPVTAKIYVVEGEKCVHALEKAGLIGVTSKGGAKSSAQTDWNPLSVFKQVCVLPDNDAPGREYAQNVIDLLADLPGQRAVTSVNLPGLPEKGDVYDFLQDHTVDELLAAIEEHGRPANPSNIATLAGPPETVTLLREIPKAEPYPVQALGADLSGVVDAMADYTAVPPAMAAQSILAAVALALQAYGNLDIDGRVSPVSLFCMTVAQTGDRKSAVDAVALFPHREWMREEFTYYREEERAYRVAMRAYNAAMKKAESKKERDKIEEAMKAVGNPPEKPKMPSFLIGNLTAEGLHKQLVENLPYCGVFSDEGGTLIGGYAMSKDQLLNTLSDFSTLWDAKGPLRARAGSGLTSPFGKRVSMHLMCQPDVAAILLGKRIAHSQGFIPRLLVTWPETLRGTRKYRRGNLKENKYVQAYNTKITNILQISPSYDNDETLDCLTPPSIVLSPQAYEIWVEFHDKIEFQNAPDGPLDCISGWASKTAEHAGRIACVLSLYDDMNTQVISEQHMIQGIALAEYYLNEMYRVHAQGARDETLLIADNLLQFMRDKSQEVDNVFGSEFLLQYGPNQIRDAVSLQQSLLLLQNMGAVEPVFGRGKKWRLK